MDIPHTLARHLDTLTEALDGTGDDLTAILHVLVDDLAAAIESFVGLSISVATDAGYVNLTMLESSDTRSSMLLPLADRSGLPSGSQLVFYARNPGAFVDLAADARAAFGLDGQVVLDGHLPPPTTSFAARQLDDLVQRSEIDRAVGLLIDQGYPPPEAQVELCDRAAAAGVTVTQIARGVLGIDR